MKKLMALLLTLTMILGCVAVFSVGAADKVLKFSVSNLQKNDSENMLVYLKVDADIDYTEGSVMSYDVYIDTSSKGIGGIDPEDGGVRRDESASHDTYHPSMIDVTADALNKWYTRSFDMVDGAAHISEMIFACEGTDLPAAFNVYYKNIVIKNAEGAVIYTMDLSTATTNTQTAQSNDDVVASLSLVDDPAGAVAPAGISITNKTPTVKMGEDGSFSFTVVCDNLTGNAKADTWIGMYPQGYTDDDFLEQKSAISMGTWAYVLTGNTDGDGVLDMTLPNTKDVVVSSDWVSADSSNKPQNNTTYDVVLFYSDNLDGSEDTGYKVVARTTVTFTDKDVVAPPTFDTAYAVVAVAVVSVLALGVTACKKKADR